MSSNVAPINVLASKRAERRAAILSGRSLDDMRLDLATTIAGAAAPAPPRRKDEPPAPPAKRLHRSGSPELDAGPEVFSEPGAPGAAGPPDGAETGKRQVRPADTPSGKRPHSTLPTAVAARHEPPPPSPRGPEQTSHPEPITYEPQFFGDEELLVKSVLREMELKKDIAEGEARKRVIERIKKIEENRAQVGAALRRVTQNPDPSSMDLLATALGYTYNKSKAVAIFLARYLHGSYLKTDSPTLLQGRSAELAHILSEAVKQTPNLVKTFIGQDALNPIVPLKPLGEKNPFSCANDGRLLNQPKEFAYTPRYSARGFALTQARLLEAYLENKPVADTLAATVRYTNNISFIYGALSPIAQALRLKKVLDQRAWARAHVKPQDWDEGARLYLELIYERYSNVDYHNLPTNPLFILTLAAQKRLEINEINDDAALGFPFEQHTPSDKGFEMKYFYDLAQTFVDDCVKFHGDVKVVLRHHPYADKAPLKAKAEIVNLDKTGTLAKDMTQLVKTIPMIASAIDPSDLKTRSYYAVSKAAFILAQLLSTFVKNANKPDEHLFEQPDLLKSRKVLPLANFPFVRGTFQNLSELLFEIGEFKTGAPVFQIYFYSDNLHLKLTLQRPLTIPLDKLGVFDNSMPFDVDGENAILPAGTRIFVSMDASKFETAVNHDVAQAYYKAVANHFSLNTPWRYYLNVIAHLCTNLTGVVGKGYGLKLDYEASGIPPTFELNDCLMFQVSRACELADAQHPEDVAKIAEDFGVLLEVENVMVLPPSGVAPIMEPRPAESAVRMDFLGNSLYVDPFHAAPSGAPVFLPVQDEHRFAGFWIDKRSLKPDVVAAKALCFYLKGGFRFPEVAAVAKALIEGSGLNTADPKDMATYLDANDVDLVMRFRGFNLSYERVVQLYLSKSQAPVFPTVTLPSYPGSWGDQSFGDESFKAVPSISDLPTLSKAIGEYYLQLGRQIPSSLVYNKNMVITGATLSEEQRKQVALTMGFNIQKNEKKTLSFVGAAASRLVQEQPNQSSSFRQYEADLERHLDFLRSKQLQETQRMRNFLEAAKLKLERKEEVILSEEATKKLHLAFMGEEEEPDEVVVTDIAPVGRVEGGLDEFGNTVAVVAGAERVVDVALKVKSTKTEAPAPVLVGSHHVWNSAQATILRHLKPGKFPQKAQAVLATLKKTWVFAKLAASLADGPEPPSVDPYPDGNVKSLLQLLFPDKIGSAELNMPEKNFSLSLPLASRLSDFERLGNTKPTQTRSIKTRQEMWNYMLIFALREAKFWAFDGPGLVYTGGQYDTGTYPCKATVEWLRAAAIAPATSS